MTNYLGELSNRSDINIFLSQYRPEAVSAAGNFTVQTVNGAIDQEGPDNSTQLQQGVGAEGNLDAETILGISFPIPMTTYNTAGSPPFTPDAFTTSNNNEPYLDWLQFVLNQTDLPQVISNSYGDDEQTVPQSYANAVCKGFAQLGARGVTVLFASGDNGVGPTGKCFANDGRNTSAFLPSFPAGCVCIISLPHILS
jgi:tripeptidyl-peptidase-1